MKILFRLATALFLLTSCGGPEMWIPQSASRPGVKREHVQYLEQPPQKAHIVIGIITPPTGEYETFAEAIKKMSREAAKHGADAIYIESQTESGGWHFSAGGPGSWGGASGGSFKEQTFRAKAIVWK